SSPHSRRRSGRWRSGSGRRSGAPPRRSDRRSAASWSSSTGTGCFSSTCRPATLVFFAGFGAMLLAGVLLLTDLWGYSALGAGFALSPGPLMAAAFAVPAGRLGDRIGQRPVAAAGGLVFAASFAWLLVAVDARPSYTASFLPVFMLGG